jgi:hypothetical protein
MTSSAQSASRASGDAVSTAQGTGDDAARGRIARTERTCRVIRCANRSTVARPPGPRSISQLAKDSAPPPRVGTNGSVAVPVARVRVTPWRSNPAGSACTSLAAYHTPEPDTTGPPTAAMSQGRRIRLLLPSHPHSRTPLSTQPASPINPNHVMRANPPDSEPDHMPIDQRAAGGREPPRRSSPSPPSTGPTTSSSARRSPIDRLTSTAGPS